MAEASPQVKTVVFNAIATIEGQYGVAHRQEIINLTGMDSTPHLVDGAIKSLIDDDHSVERIKVGVFKTVTHFPYQLMYFQALPDGSAKLEVGDNVNWLTPISLKTIGFWTAGYAMYGGKSSTAHHGQTARSLPIF